jgi:hypothetical protein
VPRQNRVTPFGALISTPARGTLMGNRGCLHDAEGRIRRGFVGTRWIACVLQFKGRRRPIMTPGQYTELFFLDEATALAAGHRPCMECQRGRYLAFRAHWLAANPSLATSPVPLVAEVDGVLHAERIVDRHDKRTYTEQAAHLPEGAMVADPEGRAWLVRGDRLLQWTPDGYGRARPRPRSGPMTVLTPPSIVRALAHGYPVEIHASAGPA